MQHQDEIYYCIATNDNDLSPEEIIKLHRQRSETSENKIKELKKWVQHELSSNFKYTGKYLIQIPKSIQYLAQSTNISINLELKNVKHNFIA